jgi:hypothetical protein
MGRTPQGPYPYVDDIAFVLALQKSTIQPNSSS